MGTNYYHRRPIRPREDPPLPSWVAVLVAAKGESYYSTDARGPECPTGMEQAHIGKPSIGRRFLFHSSAGLPWSWQGWRERLEEGEIVDQYGTLIPVSEFVETTRGGRTDTAEFVDSEGWPFDTHVFG
jgi:hypothetical protein